MSAAEKKSPDSLSPALIAPCGMDCGLCLAHLRDKNVCDGCNGDDAVKARHCSVCGIKHCEERAGGEGGLCFECTRFPCARIRQLDKRYRTKYGMSMIENLEFIRDHGIEDFVAFEQARWSCATCGGVICVHREACIYCGKARTKSATAG